MGVKGIKRTSETDLTSELLLERLSQIPQITSKKMFGGYGIFHEVKMFALVNSSGHIFVKSHETIQARFDAANAQQHGKMPYFSLADDVFNDINKLLEWARESINIST